MSDVDPSDSDDDQPGWANADCYTWPTVLARGGSATLYEAIDRIDGRSVALKVAHPDGGERIEREALVYERVSSDFLPEFLGRTEFVRRPAIVLELLRGQSLWKRLAHQPLSIAAALEATAELLTALEAVHSARFVHCDVNPANVFLHWQGVGNERVKLLDFGISVPVDTRARDSGMLEPVGTLPFMAPEQLDEGVLGLSTDLYAVGAVLYAMVTGRVPFGDLDDREQAEAIRKAAPIPPSVLRPSCSPALEALILRALSKDAHLRFARACDMRMAIARLAEADHLPRGREAFGVRASVPPSPSPFAVTRPTEPSLRHGDPRGDAGSDGDQSRTEWPTVLVVEDDDLLRRDLVTALTRIGCHVHAEADGAKALESLRSNPLPRVVLMDLMMPVMDGWAFRRAMLDDARLSSVRVVILSSVGSIEGESSRLRASAYLTKPVHPQELLETIVKQLNTAS